MSVREIKTRMQYIIAKHGIAFFITTNGQVQLRRSGEGLDLRKKKDLRRKKEKKMRIRIVGIEKKGREALAYGV